MPQLSSSGFPTSTLGGPPFFGDDGQSSTKAPPATAPADDKLGWFRRIRAESQSYQASQPPYADIDPAIQLVQGTEGGSGTRPRARVNRLKRQMREVVASLAMIRVQGWTFKTDNRDQEPQCQKLTKLIAGWFNETRAPRKLRQALQWGVAAGTGYASPWWNPYYHSRNRGDIDLAIYGPRDVTCYQLPANGSLQDAYVVTARTQIGIEAARSYYQEFAAQLQPDAVPRSRTGGNALRRLAQIVTPSFLMTASQRDQEATKASPNTISIYRVFINDNSVNGTGEEIAMGKPDTSWFYKVPALGQQIPSGIRDENGVMQMREAVRDDCYLYPTRRLQVWLGEESPICVYDGPSPDWIRGVPLVKFTVDDWPWLSLGFSLSHDGRPLQAAHTTILRSIIQAVVCRLNPHLTFNGDVISKTAMDAIDFTAPNGRLKTTGFLSDSPVKPTLPAEFYNIQEGIVKEIMPYLDNQMDYLTASRDLTAIAKAKQIPASDSIEKLLEMAGPITRDISEGVRDSLIELGGMVGALILQHYTLARRLTMLGPDGFTTEDYDFDPQNMVPSHMPWEMVLVSDPQSKEIRPEVPKDKLIHAPLPSAYSLFQRGLTYLDNFRFWITPGGAHEITQMTRQLVLLQLKKAGIPIDSFTIMEAFNIPNIGTPYPAGTNTVFDRWVWEQRFGAGLKLELAKEMGMAGLAPGKGAGGGRPNTNEKPPHVEQKGGAGGRSTISTS